MKKLLMLAAIAMIALAPWSIAKAQQQEPSLLTRSRFETYSQKNLALPCLVI